MLVSSVLGAPLRFLDITPIGRLIARFTQDIRAVDVSLAGSTRTLFVMTSALTIQLATIVLFTPIYIIPGVALALATYLLGIVYIAAQLSVKRFVPYISPRSAP